jgi:hypothetical protein
MEFQEGNAAISLDFGIVGRAQTEWKATYLNLSETFEFCIETERSTA